MRYWLFIFALFCMIIYAQRVSDSKATREVIMEITYDTTNTDSVDAIKWKLKSDSINQITKR